MMATSQAVKPALYACSSTIMRIAPGAGGGFRFGEVQGLWVPTQRTSYMMLLMLEVGLCFAQSSLKP
jgi:hypothetical protein